MPTTSLLNALIAADPTHAAVVIVSIVAMGFMYRLTTKLASKQTPRRRR